MARVVDVVAAGTGARLVPAPEMAAFAERFGFVFRAHEKGDANRSACVERPFHFIEHNFWQAAALPTSPISMRRSRAIPSFGIVKPVADGHLHASNQQHVNEAPDGRVQ
ncbi:MAG TPA: hypothetical protein VI485_25855 [Vicinamibacterales bacterium]|nr:hypothetical protein [Vicinamibacterales bacterium]